MKINCANFKCILKTRETVFEKEFRKKIMHSKSDVITIELK